MLYEVNADEQLKYHWNNRRERDLKQKYTIQLRWEATDILYFWGPLNTITP
jgi:hypothetical protein